MTRKFERAKNYGQYEIIPRRQEPVVKVAEPIEMGDEYDTHGYYDRIHASGVFLVAADEAPVKIDLALCWFCQSANSYKCLTKNRMFCWDCGRYYGSSH